MGKRILLADDVELSAQGIVTDNGRYDLWSSEVIGNENKEAGNAGAEFDSLRLTVRYQNPKPASNLSLQAIIESSNGQGKVWGSVGNQFDYYTGEGGHEQVIQIQPNLFVTDPGIPELVFTGDDHTGSVSRQSSRIGSDFRVKIICSESFFGSDLAFQSVMIDVFGELYNS